MKRWHRLFCAYSYVAMAVSVLATSAGSTLTAQDWLTDQSFRPVARQPPIPTIPSEGLIEPPPPLEPSLPPTVFEEEAAKQGVDMGPVWYYP